jgi:hypothetical protein
MFMQPPARFAPAETAPSVSGLLGPTLVETETGWRPAATLARGDRLYSFDGGLRRVVALGHDWLMPGSTDIVHLPGGLLGAMDDVQLLPMQRLLVDTWSSLPDAVVALVPARAADVIGASICPLNAPIEVVTPVFEDEEAIYASGGLLLHCPGIESGTTRAEAGFFPVLDLDRARLILSGRENG